METQILKWGIILLLPLGLPINSLDNSIIVLKVQIRWMPLLLRVAKYVPPPAVICRGVRKSVEKASEVDDVDSQNGNTTPSTSFSSTVSIYVQPASFPQKLAKARIEKRYGKYLQMVCNGPV